MSIEKENINPWILNEKDFIEKKELLEKLAYDISKKYWIEKQRAKELIERETIDSIESLKHELENQEKKLDKKELEELFFSIKQAIELIKSISKVNIEKLKKELESSKNIEDYKNVLEEYLPKKLVYKAQNPQAIEEHILWFALWSANSIISSAEFLYNLWKWIVQTPYHLYLILSWKWEVKSFKDI
jgi:hypothetical protein